MFVKEEVEGDFQHLVRLGKAFGPSIETSQIIPNTAIGRFNEVRFCLGNDMGFGQILKR